MQKACWGWGAVVQKIKPSEEQSTGEDKQEQEREGRGERE